MSIIKKWFTKSQSQDPSKISADERAATQHPWSDHPLKGDNPIKDAAEDLLDRVGLARLLADQIASIDASEGVVVGLLGPWGSGKTSLLNLTKEELPSRKIAVIEFNPWMFSGTEQLVGSFFVEVAAQLELKAGLTEAASAMEEYGEAFSGLGWLPIAGPWLEGGAKAAKSIGAFISRRKQGVQGRRARLEAALLQRPAPIAIILDDIDRLTTPEIRDIFRLVRLTASFPNIVYVVAFDRHRVERALDEQGVPGRQYLEKILQLAIDVPVVPTTVLSARFFEAIEGALAGIEHQGHFDTNEWPDIYVEVIRPFVQNMRDVRRYAAALRGSVMDLNGQIELVDVFALEAVRVFLPDVFAELHRAIPGLTSIESGYGYGASDPPHLKQQVERLVELAGDKHEVVRSMVRRLFPGGQRHIGGMQYGPDFVRGWLRKRRVAHEDIIRLYLERLAGSELQALDYAEAAWIRMHDVVEFDSFLRALPADSLRDVIAHLESFEEEFGEHHVVPGCVVLLNLVSAIPDKPRGMLEFDNRLVVGRVVYRLLRSLGTQDKVAAAVEAAYPKLSGLSAKLELLDDVGYREGVGHELVSEAAAAAFERRWRDDVRAAATEQLAAEPNLLRIMLLVGSMKDPAEPELPIPDDPEFTAAILRTGQTETVSQEMGSRSVRRSPRLAWDAIVEMYGTEETLRARIDGLREAQGLISQDLLELADRYLAGWRPDH